MRLEPKPGAGISLKRDLHDSIESVLHRGATRASRNQIERALDAIRSLSVIGLVVVAVYGASASAIGHTLAGVSIALCSAGAAFAVGGLLGFLFGMPRRPDQGTVTVPVVAKGAAAAGAPNAQSIVKSVAIRPNTSLERISEWLTTLIVGLGIANFKEVFDRWNEMSIWVTNAITGAGTYTLPANGTSGAVLLFAYSIAGFMLVYLWSQRYLGSELHQAEHDMEMDDMRQELRHTGAVADRANMLAQATALYGQKEYEKAASAYKEVLDLDQSDAVAKMGLALSKSYMPAPGPDEALTLLEEMISKDPKNALAMYNKACILAAEKKAATDVVMTVLKQAIALDEQCRARAKDDEDFARLRDELLFKDAVKPPPPSGLQGTLPK